MRLSVKLLGILAVLLMVLSVPASASTAKPQLAVVSGSIVVSPGTVMAGDSGTITITVANTMKSAGAGDTHSTQDVISYGAGSSNPGTPNAVDYTHSTTTMTTSTDAANTNAYLKSVSLGSSGPIHVDPQQPQGTMLGMGDTVTYTFSFTVDSSAQDGLYQLLFHVSTDDDGVYLNYMVPVRVDNTPVAIYVNDAPKSFGTAQKSVTLDVVNNRGNDVNSVSIIPAGDGYSFKPQQEYIVGNIGAGEMYTAQITVTSDNASNSADPQFVVKYKNGNNWHESVPATVYVDNSEQIASAGGSDNSLLYVLLIIVAALVVIGGLFLFLRSKRAKQ